MHLAEKAGLWTDERKAAAREVERRIQAGELSVVRLSFADQHGILRGKTYVAGEIAGVMKSGVGFSATMLMKDTAHKTVFPVWGQGGAFGAREWEGAADVVMLPDPSTFRVLPWAPHTGWMLCDIYLKNGSPVPFSTRHVYRRALDRLGAAGFDFIAGLEVEFYVVKLDQGRLRPEDATQPPPAPDPRDIGLVAYGYHYLTELRVDQLDNVIQLLLRGGELPSRDAGPDHEADGADALGPLPALALLPVVLLIGAVKFEQHAGIVRKVVELAGGFLQQ